MATTSRKGRVGQAQYWTIFGIYVVAVAGLVGFSFYSFAAGELSLGVTAILPLAPLGLYFRVIEMRRCRDIGWPSFLPWLLFVVPLAFALIAGLGGLGSGTGLAVTSLTVPLLISLVDFAFSIVIGCIATKDPGEDYAQIFGSEPRPARPGNYQDPRPANAPGYDRFDEAIARALEARHTSIAESAPALTLDPAAITPTAHARAVAGFGRKGI